MLEYDPFSINWKWNVYIYINVSLSTGDKYTSIFLNFFYFFADTTKSFVKINAFKEMDIFFFTTLIHNRMCKQVD